MRAVPEAAPASIKVKLRAIRASDSTVENDGIGEVVGGRWPGARIRALEPLTGDAGIRSYTRLSLEGGDAPARVMAMLFAGDGSARRPEEGGAGGTRNELPFVNVQRFLAAHAIPVPEIVAVAEDKGVLLLEDLGDRALADAVTSATPGERERLLHEAVALLARICALGTADPAGCYAFDQVYDASAIALELEVTVTYGLAHARGMGVTAPGEDPRLERALQSLGARIAALPRGLMHRDYHAWNLHLDAAGRMRVIDFQDATIGPALYDLASLLTDRDTDRFVEPALEAALVRAWSDDMVQLGAHDHAEAAALEASYFAAVAYRTLRVIGRFGVLALDLGKPGYFERYAPRMAKQTMRALDALGEEELAELLFERSPIFL
jgi:aminoglycoside/choline kinase family phosphotransferase